MATDSTARSESALQGAKPWAIYSDYSGVANVGQGGFATELDDLEHRARIAAFVATGFGMGEHGCPLWRRRGKLLRKAHALIRRAKEAQHG